MVSKSTVILHVLFTIMTFALSQANVINVPSEQPTIQAGIDSASDGDTVLVADGVYSEHVIVSGGPSVYLVSVNGPGSTWLNGRFHFLEDADNRSIIDGFKIGKSSGSRAMTIYSGNQVTITNCLFAYVASGTGGLNSGILCRASGVSILNCTFQDMYEDGATCAVTGYYADNLLIDNCLFIGSQVGAAIHLVHSANTVISRCLAYDNASPYGFLQAEITPGLLVSNNTLVANGGGLCMSMNGSYDGREEVHIVNNIISYGGTLWLDSRVNPTIQYNLFYGNDGGDIHGATLDSTNLFLNPRFVFLQERVLNLGSQSPCLDAGDPSAQYNDEDGSRNDIGSTGWREWVFDGDRDLRYDLADNCPDISNWLQSDSDQDGIGNACCCGAFTQGYTGNTNCDVDGKRNLADVVALIDHIYLSKTELCCPLTGNVNGSEDGNINLADIVRLIDHVYLSKTETEFCQ